MQPEKEGFIAAHAEVDDCERFKFSAPTSQNDLDSVLG